ncbi:MAG: M1 family peptidase [Gammaproteobacteria bacterium]|nr:M1 family peptidase [Gammaproteobacteria bacterium]
MDPDSGTLQASDQVEIDGTTDNIEFVLNAGLVPRSEHGRIEQIATSADTLRSTYRLRLETASDRFELHYRGQPVFSTAKRPVGAMPQGIVSAEAVYLDGASAWYPEFGRPVDRLRLHVTLPRGWQSVSNGARGESDSGFEWRSDKPQDDVYLVAGRFTRHARTESGIVLSVYLLDDDPALAERYLDAMGDYIKHYSRLIGPYPYAKFAVVENPWQTGFGMPSFTLLGSRVLRLPFILYTSLPHEILHNWWGNGVWVDYAAGNWSEGLTAYLADHWMQEREGKGDQYRLKALQNYSNFAARADDTPLRAFVSRHSDASQSIGYSKSLMLFHMIRQSTGDRAFVTGLRRLWHNHRFEAIGFERALRTLLDDDPTRVTQFLPWLDRRGAPKLVLGEAAVQQVGEAWQLTLNIAQSQQEPFAFELPVAVTLAGRATAEVRRVMIGNHLTQVDLTFDAQPLRIDIDPAYDVMRELDPSEQPPVLSRLFGSRKAWLIVPTGASPAEREAWTALADAWQERYPGLKRLGDDAADTLDQDADRIILGWDNRLAGQAWEMLSRPDQRIDATGVQVGDVSYGRKDSAVVIVATAPHDASIAFIGAPTTPSIALLARKLPHYGSYGRLLFDAQGNNLRKDTLLPAQTQMTRLLTPRQVPLRLPARDVLGAEAP